MRISQQWHQWFKYSSGITQKNACIQAKFNCTHDIPNGIESCAIHNIERFY